MYIHPPLSRKHENNLFLTHQQKVRAKPQSTSTSTRPPGAGATSPSWSFSPPLLSANFALALLVRRRVALPLSLTADADDVAPEPATWPWPAGGYRCASHWRPRSANRGPAVRAIRMWNGARGAAWSPILVGQRKRLRRCREGRRSSEVDVKAMQCSLFLGVHGGCL